MASDGGACRCSVPWRGRQQSRRWSWLRFASHAGWALPSGVPFREHGNWRPPRGEDVTRRAKQGGSPAALDGADERSPLRRLELRSAATTAWGGNAALVATVAVAFSTPLAPLTKTKTSWVWRPVYPVR